MGIFHDFSAPGVDDPNVDIVRLRDWNDDHASPSHLLMFWNEATLPDGDDWTDQPAAVTRLFNDERTYLFADLRWATEARLVTDVVAGGASGSEIRAQYSNDGLTWAYLNGVDGPAQSIASIGLFASEWAVIEAAARLESIRVRIVGLNGNGAADPRLRSVRLYIR